MTAENDLPDLDDIDREEKLLSFSDCVRDTQNEHTLRAKAVMSYLSNAQLFGQKDFDEIKAIVVHAVAVTSPAWRKCLERQDYYGQDMITESLLSIIDDMLEEMFTELVGQADVVLGDEDDIARPGRLTAARGPASAWKSVCSAS